MKQHLKRHFAPKSWPIARKAAKFLVRPLPGGQEMELSLPLTVVLRDVLEKVKTRREAKKLLAENEVLIDGKRRKNSEFTMGLLDVLSLPLTKENYRMVLSKKGKLVLIPIDEKESKIKVCRVKGKNALKGNKIQLNLHDGKNIPGESKIKVGDSVLLSLPENKISEVLELKPGAFIYVIKGKRSGETGILKEIKEEKLVYEADKKIVETLKKYVMVLGKEKPAVKLENEQK